MDVDPVGALLQAVGMAEAADEPFDGRAVADELGLSPGDLRGLVQQVEGLGLALVGNDERPPVLMRAGRQFLRLGCEFDEHALGFLPRTIDDLFARRALLCGGSVLVDTFRGALIAGKGVERAREIVPPAFERAPSLPTSDETLTIRDLLTLRARFGACWDVAGQRTRWRWRRGPVRRASRRRARGIGPRRARGVGVPSWSSVPGAAGSPRSTSVGDPRAGG